MPNPKLPVVLTACLGVRYHFTFLGQTVMNTLYYMANGPMDPLPPLDGVLTLVRNTIEGEWLASISEETVIQKVEARWINFPEVQYASQPDGVTAGTREGAPCTSFVALRVYRRTGFGGRRGRGMIRIAGISETDTVGNQVALGLQPQLDDLTAVLATGITGGVLGANVLLPALVTTEPNAEAFGGFTTRGAAVMEWEWSENLGSQLSRKARQVV